MAASFFYFIFLKRNEFVDKNNEGTLFLITFNTSRLQRSFNMKFMLIVDNKIQS
jgi:hypothetical protein